MLKYMRSHMGKTFLMILVGLMSFVFVLWGVFPELRGRGFSGGAEDVATVGDERITVQELQQGVNREVETYRQFGQPIPDALMPQVRQQVLQGLVSQRLLQVEGKRLGISPSDEAVRAEIEKIPSFQQEDPGTKVKRFNKDLYQKVLAANHLVPGEFEDRVRAQLRQGMLLDFLRSRIRITENEVEREYHITNEQRNLQFVRLTRESAFGKMHVDEAAVKKFLADPKSQPAINAYYERKNSEYNKDEATCARHILFRAKPETKSAPAEMLAIHPTASNFASLAEKHSQDPSGKGKGGDLGCFPRGMMDKEFEAAAFGAKVGSVTKPVHSSFGWHYIYVYKKTPAVHRKLEDVRREIAESILKEEQPDLIRKTNEAAAEAIAKSWPPKGVEVQETGWFNRLQGFVPKIGRADELLNAAFDSSAKIQKGPQIFESMGSFIIARIKESRSADMKKFADNKATEVKTLQERKYRAFLPAWMQDVSTQTKVSINEKLLQEL